MKNFLILSSFLLFTYCSNFAPVASDICKISEEICYYANAICEIYGSIPESNKNESIKNDLFNSSIILKNIFSKSLILKRDENKLLDKSEVLNELILIRNKLKSTLEQLQER